MSHFSLTLFLSALIAIAIALLGQRTKRDRIHHAVYTFLICLTSTVAAAWAMRLIHG